MSTSAFRIVNNSLVQYCQLQPLFRCKWIYMCQVPSQKDGIVIHTEIDIYEKAAAVILTVSKMAYNERYYLFLKRPDMKDIATNSFWVCIDASIVPSPNLTEEQKSSLVTKAPDGSEIFSKVLGIGYVMHKNGSFTIIEKEKIALMEKIQAHIVRLFPSVKKQDPEKITL